MKIRTSVIVAFLALSSCDVYDETLLGGTYTTAGDCRPDAGDPHYCEHYQCNAGTCEYSWDGGAVTCGNERCVEPSDCATSTPTISISCVSGSCIGSP